MEKSPGLVTATARTGRPWRSALQAVLSSTGLTAIPVTISPPVMVTAQAPDKLPRTSTVLRKWIKSRVGLAPTSM